MKIAYFVAVVCMAGAGCSSVGDANVLQVSPTQGDWEAAFSRLSSAERTILMTKPLWLGLSDGPVGEAVYDIIDGHGSNRVDRDEHLDIPAICEGFNQRFGNARAERWQVIAVTTLTGVSTPGGISTDRFDLKWTFHSSTGRVVVASATDFGPGVKIIWGASREAIVAEINQAFALTFLKMVVKLERTGSGK